MAGEPIYTLGEELGRGALGRVVRVHRGDGDILAGKILHASHRADSRARGRFACEAEIVAELRHPNIASVYGLREIDGEQVLLMELIEGDSLARVIAASGPMDEARLVAIGRGIASGLAAAHHSGLIHRDLKPDNILIERDSDEPKIVDFGLARATSFAGVDVDAFAVVGTPDYMAPESIDPLAVDARSDLYALGCILFEMATGAPPFGGATAFAVIEAHCEAAVDVATLEARLSTPLVELITSLLAKSPADRPQSAAALEAALEGVVGQSPAALVVAQTAAIAATTSCASCGAPALPEVSVCFGCGAAQVSIERGNHTVFVTGPGEVTDKLDSRLRQVLIDWLDASSSLGLDSSRLSRRAPRLPFVLATRVAASSAASLVRSLESLGFAAEARRGGRFSLPEMRKKGWSLGGRIALIGVSGLAYGLHNIIGPALLPLVGLGGVIAVGSGFAVAGKPAVSQQHQRRSSLPDALTRSLGRVADVIPAISEARHRDSLRAIVQRVLAVRDVVPAERREAVDAELCHLIDLAVFGATRIDQIDARLAERDLRNADDDDRGAMRERDNWAARLLEITAFLDAMRVRYVAVAGESAERAPVTSVLDELRIHIEALEEISALS